MMKTITLFFLSALLSLSVSLMAHPAPMAPEDQGLAIEATIYPNPTSGQFHLSIVGEIGERYELKITNLIGQTIEQQEIEPTVEYSFDLSPYPKGIYFVQIEAGNESFIKRLVVR